MYEFIYENEKEFRKLERALKGINLLAYNELFYKVYPNLKKGNFKHAKKNGSFYEFELSTDELSEKVYLTKYKLLFQKQENLVKLIEIVPKEILLEYLKGNTINYKGVIIPKNSEIYMFKTNLIIGIRGGY